MAPNHDFDTIYNQVYCSGTADNLKHAKLNRLLPSQKDQDEFWRYHRQDIEDTLKKQCTPPTTRQELCRSIDRRKLSSLDVHSELVHQLDHEFCPWLPIGTDRTGQILYRLKPDPFALLPHKPVPPKTGRQRVSLALLGTNETRTVQSQHPQSRRKANYSDESSSSAQSGESDDSSQGIMFLQLGRLEWVNNAEGIPTNELDRFEEADWEDTGFVVVARISSAGVCDAICVVCDFFPTNWETGDRHEIKPDGDWGRLPYVEDGRFAYATIGRRLADMGFHKLLKCEGRIKNPIQLVGLVRAANQQLLQSTIA